MELSELTTASALFFTEKEYDAAISDDLVLKKFCNDSIKVMKSKNIIFGNETTRTTSIAELTLLPGGIHVSENVKKMKDFLVGISAAKAIKNFAAENGVTITNKAKVYMTGGTWPKEILKFKVNTSGMVDYNSSDIMVTEDGIKFFGISLKKKSRVNEDDPTLINKAFNTLLTGPEFKVLNEQLDEERIKYFTDLVIEAVNMGFIDYTDINDTSGKPLKSKKEWETFSKSEAGRNELYLSKKKNKNLFEYRYIDTKGSTFLPEGYITTKTKGDKTMRQWVNKQLASKDCPLWQGFLKIMNKYSEEFADKLIDIILKTNLYESMDAKTLEDFDFDFALVTGVANLSPKGLISLGAGSVIPLGTTLCGLKRIEHKYKTSKFKIEVDEVKQTSTDMAGVSMILERGQLKILNLVLRYKGHYTVQPSFLATIDDDFKNLLKKECTGFR